jgi:phosphoglycolate phosphatase-like HAD superfamily hydrolase
MKHWVFDLDGTLVDSFSHYFVLLSDIFSTHGARFSDELRRPALTQSVAEFFEQHLGPEAVPSAVSVLHERSIEDAKHIRPFTGMLPTIRSLKENGSRVAVWTNRDLASAQSIILHSGLKPFIELCVSGNCTVQRKPNPEGLLRIVQHFGCDAASVTMVGDHDFDVMAAKTAGARGVRANWHAYWKPEPCAHSDFQFSQIEDFKKWIERKL